MVDISTDGRWRPSGHCGLVALDIASFCDDRRTDHVRQHLRRALYDVWRKSFAGCRISINDYYFEDRGDGVIIAVAPEIGTVVLVSTLIDWIHSGLRRHNEVSSEIAQIRLRIAIHAGEVHTDDHGLVGTAVNHVFRLVDAPVLKQMLADSTAVLALVASARVYDDVIRHSPDLVDPAEYHAMPVHTKETVAPAWVRLLGCAGHPVPTTSGRRAPVGRSTTSFVGRERELVQLRTLIMRSRLVTLTGPGGAGKTRLAVEVLRTLTKDDSAICADGAYLIDLAGYRAGDDLCLALLATLRLATRSFYGPPGRGPTDDALVAALAGRQVLLVLDNCEHLLDDVARLADTVLTRAEDTTLLATSREALGVADETTFVVGPLTLPREESGEGDLQEIRRCPAVRLFLDRARSADPGFRLTEQNCADVARICRRLDGLPLPIELAAARARALTPSQIADRLADRFRLLANGSRTVSRHRTLAAVVDWSHDLLDEPAREVFAYLSIFRGGFGLCAVEDLAARLDICPATTADLVVRLVDKSLLQATPADDGTMRYRMLETLREYASARLAERGQAHHAAVRHAELYVELAEKQSPVLRSAQQGSAIRILEREDDNLRTAFEFCCRTGNHELALRLVAALGWYLWMRGDRAFGWRGVSRALGIAPHEQDPLRRARALIWSCHLGSVGQRAVEPEARAHARQAQTILEDLGLTGSVEYGYCMFASAFACYRENKHAEGNTLIRRARALGAELGDKWLLACATLVAGIGHALRGEFADSEHLLKASAEHTRTTGDAWLEHRCLIWLSRAYESIGALERAEETAEDAMRLVAPLELSGAVVPLLGWMARLRILRGDEAGAASALADVERNRWWRTTSEGIGWIIECRAMLIETKALNQSGADPALLREAADLYGQAASELATVGLSMHALHSRCRQVILLAHLGDPIGHALDEASRLVDALTHPRARIIAAELDRIRRRTA